MPSGLPMALAPMPCEAEIRELAKARHFLWGPSMAATEPVETLFTS